MTKPCATSPSWPSGFDTRIICIVNRVNASDCLTLLDIADEIGVSLVKYHVFSVIGSGHGAAEWGMQPTELITFYEHLERVAPSHHTRAWYQPAYARRDRIAGYAADGYRGCIGRTLDRISIFPDGRAYVCSYCLRLIARRTPRPAAKPAKPGEHPDWEYGAFVTSTPGGQVQFPGARHRTQAHVEDRIKQFKACSDRNLPSTGYGRNAAWLQLAALATSLTAWLRHLGLDGELATASTKTLRFRILSAPARLVTHARRRILKIPPGWQWPSDLATAWDRLHALHPA